VGQGMFQLLREVNRMEREMCQHLDWELNVEPQTLSVFKDMVRKDFAGPGPYPVYTRRWLTKAKDLLISPLIHQYQHLQCLTLGQSSVQP